MTKVSKSNLGYLGVDFQYKLISAFIEDPNFFRDLESVIDQNMFTETYLRTSVCVMKEYYSKYGSVPSYDMILIKIREKITNEDDLEYYTEAINAIRETSLEGYQEIEAMSEKFFFQQHLIKMSNQLTQMAGDGDLSTAEACKELLEKALSVGRKSDDTWHPFDNIDGDLAPQSVVSIPTGIEKIDDCLGGGLDKGKVGLIICAMGAGKALPVTEPVATPTGFQQIGSIKVGDYVIGRNGLPTRVTGVFPQGIRDIYRVTFSDGVYCNCDLEHLWTTNEVGTKTLGQLMSMTFNNEWAGRFSIPMCEKVEFDAVTCNHDPYEYAKEINQKDFLSKDFDVTCFINSSKVRIELLQGLIENYGVIENGICSIQVNNPFIGDIVPAIVQSLGGWTKFTTKNENETWVTVELFDGNIKLYKDPEQQYNVQYLNHTNDKRYISNVEYVGKQDAVCIKVDAEDELFLTNSYIVTHNTSMTTCMAANAATTLCEANNYKGFKVLQIVFEDIQRDMNRKYMSKLSQIESRNLSADDTTITHVKDILNNSSQKDLINKNVTLKRLPTGEITASKIKEIIKKTMNEGFKPDMVIIDYFECIEPEPGMSRYDVTMAEGKTMRKFETMASELDMAFWIPTQGNRTSINTELVTNDMVGGSIRKNQIAQVVLSITRSVDDLKNKKATLAILKNRSGAAGITLNGILFDNGTCTITSDNAIEFEDALSYNEYAKQKEEDIKNKMIQEALSKI